MIPDGIAFKTTSLCQGNCNDCSVREWMKFYPNWHTSLEDTERFIYYSKKSNYEFGIINLTGGEPLLWKNLLEGTKMLWESKLTKKLVMYTNALGFNESRIDEMGELLSYLHVVRISLYSGNAEKAHLFKEKFPDKAYIKSQIVRATPPIEEVPDSLPAQCQCTGYSFNHGVVDICAPARTIIVRMGWNLEDFDYISTPLEKNYLDKFKDVDRENQKLCQYCIGNIKVFNVVPRSDCLV